MLQDRLWNETRIEKHKFVFSDFHRFRGIQKPGFERNWKRSQRVRRNNRRQVSFLCRYVMTNKHGTRVDLE